VDNLTSLRTSHSALFGTGETRPARETFGRAILVYLAHIAAEIKRFRPGKGGDFKTIDLLGFSRRIRAIAAEKCGVMSVVEFDAIRDYPSFRFLLHHD
jgi:hypothetical protein